MVSNGGGQGHCSFADSGKLTQRGPTGWVSRETCWWQGNGECGHPEVRVSFRSTRGQGIRSFPASESVLGNEIKEVEKGQTMKASLGLGKNFELHSSCGWNCRQWFEAEKKAVCLVS